jgi:quinolinate synthase
MAMNSLYNLAEVLVKMDGPKMDKQIIIDEETRKKAVLLLERMLEFNA